MSYCSSDDIIKRLDETIVLGLTDDQGDGVIDSSVLDACIEDADAIIDETLSDKVSLVHPALLRRIACDIAIYFLFLRKNALIDEKNNIHRERYERAIGVLSSLASSFLFPESTTADKEKVFSLDSESFNGF